jgi:bacterial leucyl aminopeptidase
MKSPAQVSLLSIALSALVSTTALAEPLRLVETSPSARFWTNAKQRAELSARSHAEGKCGGYMDITDFEISRRALLPVRLDLAGREPKEQARVAPLIAKVNEADLFALVTKLSAFPDRDYNTDSGVKAATWIRSRYEEIAHGRSDIKVDFFAHKGFKQPSVIAEIPGTGPDRAEIVVLGGHLDSISYGAAPGADDNASGTATVMEAFRMLVESGYAPNRTLLFMGYAGEEHGLLGSGEIATWFRNKNRPVVGALQFDMTMYPGSSPSITFISDYTNKDLNRFTQRLSDEYVKTKWIEDKCGYPCSDHASWNRAGFASTFPFESSFRTHNPDIHTPRDTTKNLSAGHGAKYLKLALAFAIEMAEANVPAWRLR